MLFVQLVSLWRQSQRRFVWWHQFNHRQSVRNHPRLPVSSGHQIRFLVNSIFNQKHIKKSIAMIMAQIMASGCVQVFWAPFRINYPWKNSNLQIGSTFKVCHLLIQHLMSVEFMTRIEAEGFRKDEINVDRPNARNTTFGWIVYGALPDEYKSMSHVSWSDTFEHHWQSKNFRQCGKALKGRWSSWTATNEKRRGAVQTNF